MPVHIDEMTSEVGILDEELPLTRTQVERLVQIVLNRLELNQRKSRQASEETGFRSSMAPSVPTVD